MSGLRAGQRVDVSDPLGYSGTGVVEEVTSSACLVKMATITDRSDQSVVGRSVWVLLPHVSPAQR